MLTGIPRLYFAIGGGIVAFAIILAIWLHFRHDGKVAKELAGYKEGAEQVVFSLEHATGHKQAWETAPGQIVALGEGIRQRDDAIRANNEKIDDLARKAIAAKAKAVELKKIADKAQAQRNAALKRLSDLAVTPGTREDCLTLLKEADDALDMVRKAGG